MTDSWNQLTLTARDAIMVGTILLPIFGVWLRLETKMARLDTSVEDIKRLVLNGSYRKPSHRRKTR